MKPLTTILTDLTLVGFILPSMAQEKPSLLYGTVVRADAANGKVVIAPKDGPQVTVATDANTKIQVSGKDATLGDVKPGMILRVSPATGTAADIGAFRAQTPQ